MSTTGTTLVCLDSDDRTTAPMLRCTLAGQRWNGWLWPIATAEAFATFLAQWRTNDPNGEWGRVAVSVDSGDLWYVVDGEVTDVFPRCGTTPDSTPLYSLDGWTWVAPAVAL